MAGDGASPGLLAFDILTYFLYCKVQRTKRFRFHHSRRGWRGSVRTPGASPCAFFQPPVVVVLAVLCRMIWAIQRAGLPDASVVWVSDVLLAASFNTLHGSQHRYLVAISNRFVFADQHPDRGLPQSC